jgi:hypothetical protein
MRLPGDGHHVVEIIEVPAHAGAAAVLDGEPLMSRRHTEITCKDLHAHPCAL